MMNIISRTRNVIPSRERFPSSSLYSTTQNMTTGPASTQKHFYNIRQKARITEKCFRSDILAANNCNQ